MEKLRLFDTLAQYNSAVSDFEYPTVSYIEGEDEVRFMAAPQHDYSQDYLTFEALESGTFSVTINAQSIDRGHAVFLNYSLDEGTTWVNINLYDEASNNSFYLDPDDDYKVIRITTPTIQSGNKVLWKGWFDKFGDLLENGGANFSSTCRFSASGNIGTLMRGMIPDWWEGNTYNVRGFFYYCTTLVSAEHLYMGTEFELPDGSETHTAEEGLREFFIGCTNLVTPPELPATTLTTSYCYYSMFGGCTSLTTAPALPATTLSNYCYSGMFINCPNLVNAPELPATTLAQNCYRNMFERCTGLTTAPVLPASTLVNYCYYYMFFGCSSLNYIKMMATSISVTGATSNWVSGVASTGTFVKNSSAEWSATGASAIPTNWTVETASS